MLDNRKIIIIIIISCLILAVFSLLVFYLVTKTSIVSRSAIEYQLLDNISPIEQAILAEPANQNILLRENSGCQIVTSEEQKQVCQENILLLEAIMLKNPVYCQQLPHYQDNCLTNIAQKTVDLDLCQKLSQVNAQDYCHDLIIFKQAVKGKDKSLCEQLIIPSQKNDCLNTIKLNK